MAEYTRDIQQLQRTANTQPQFAPPSQSLAGDVVNLIGTGLDFYAKSQAKDELQQVKAAQAAQDTRIATGQEQLRQIRLVANQPNVSGTQVLKLENDMMKGYSPTEWQTILKGTNTTTGTTTAQVMSSADAAIKKRKEDFYKLVNDVNEVAPYLPYNLSADASEEELQSALIQGNGIKAAQVAKEAKIDLDTAELSLGERQETRARMKLLSDFSVVGGAQYQKTANSLMAQANFDDPSQVNDLLNQNKALEMSYIEQAVRVANESGIPLTPAQAREQLAPDLQMFDNVSNFLKRKDIAEIGKNQIDSRVSNMMLAMSKSKNPNQRNLAVTMMMSNSLPKDAIGKKMLDAYAGALMDIEGDDIAKIFLGDISNPTPKDEKVVQEIKKKGSEFFIDVAKNVDENFPVPAKVAVGNVMKEKLQAGKTTRERMINEGGLVTYVRAMAQGTPEMLLMPEDRDEILLGIADYGQDFLRRSIPQLLETQVPADASTFTRPLFPRGNEVGLRTTKTVNKLNALDPDTLRVTWNQDAPISDSVRKYNKFVGEFFTALDKLGATKEEVNYYKNEIARGFIVANQSLKMIKDNAQYDPVTQNGKELIDTMVAEKLPKNIKVNGKLDVFTAKESSAKANVPDGVTQDKIRSNNEILDSIRKEIDKLGEDVTLKSLKPEDLQKLINASQGGAKNTQTPQESNVETLSDTGRKTQSGRPVYTNQYGDFVTERTATVESKKLGGYVNIPTVYDGRFVSEQEALRIVEGADGKDPITGQRLKVYNNVDTAVKDAVSKSKNLGRELNN